jgi:catechol 2,3-dioxygenase-like lactoylglutathione lyase family enzyme
MTKKRTGDPWRSAADYGRDLPAFSVDLLVGEIDRSLRFYTEVLGATVHYSDPDFAALNLAGVEFMLHADHAFDGHPLYGRTVEAALRGAGAHLRVLGVDPDAVERRAVVQGAEVIQPAGDRGHGWRDVTVADPDGYVWAVGVALG